MNALIKSALIPEVGDSALLIASRRLVDQTNLVTSAFLFISLACLMLGLTMLIAILAARFVYWLRHGSREKSKQKSSSWPINGLRQVQATNRFQLKQD